MPDNRPIGVFDSGVGGLTVLRAIQEALPHESTIYLGDLARCPYGPRPQAEVRNFALQIGDALIDFDVKALVIACNTATAAAFGDLRARSPVPVVGVIEPGASEAARITRNGRVGVIATDGTVASGAYARAINDLLPSATVISRSASWLVPLIERGAVARQLISTRLRQALADMHSDGIDTLILGCTHFPIVRDVFESSCSPGVMVVDSAATTAAEVKRVLAGSDLLSAGVPRHRILVTGPAEAFAERAQAMFRSSPPIETIDWMLDAVPS